MSRIALSLTTALVAAVVAAVPAAADVRLSNDTPAAGGYVTNWAVTSGTTVVDPTIDECARARGRQNEPAVEIDPRDNRVIVGSSNDYCGVYNAEAGGLPAPLGPIYLGYYRSENGGALFQSSLVPGYAGDTTPNAALAAIRTATAGDPVIAWDGHGRLFMGAEASDDPAGTAKGYGDQWVATYTNTGAQPYSTRNDGKRFARAVTVAKGAAAPNYNGKFHDKPMIAADSTGGACDGTVYYAWSRFSGNGGVAMYASRSTDHGVSFSNPLNLAPNAKDVQFADIAITGDGTVTITFNSFPTKAGQQTKVLYVTSRNCGATFSPPKTLVAYDDWAAGDVGAPQPTPTSAAPDDPGFAESEAGGEAGARDCGDFADACASGFTFFRADSASRATADQHDPGSRSVYVVYNAGRPGTAKATGTTYGTAGPGTATQSSLYLVRLNVATGAVSTPRMISPQARGHQLFGDLAIDAGVLHAIWYDSRNDVNGGDITLPIGNRADRTVGPGLDAYGAASSNGGMSWSESRLSDQTTSPNYEQFGNRQVPFAGDYLWVSSAGGRTFGVWTDWRDTVAGSDPREGSADDGDGADVRQCRTLTAGVWSGDTCPREGGLDQNIYGDLVP